MEEYPWSKVEHSRTQYGVELSTKVANKLKNDPEKIPGYSACNWQTHSIFF